MNTHSQGIPPYWTRFGSFFIYPLAMEPLLACLGFGLLTGLASVLFTPANLILLLLVLAGTLRYGYKVLERTARGYLEDGLVFVESSHGGKYLPYKQFVVIAIGLTLCGYASYLGGNHLAAVLFVLFAMTLPANTMLLAVSNDLGESISPPRLWSVMYGIGVPYLGLCACLLLLSSSSGVLLRYLVPIVSPALIGVLGGFVGAWFTVVMFRLMGYALYQYHDVLGVSVDLGFEHQAPAGPREDPARQRAQQVAGLLKAGDYEAAIALARAEVTELPGDFAANQRLYRLLQAVPGQESALQAHAGEWLLTLLHGGKFTQAVEVLEIVWQGQPEYRPPLPSLILPLAQACFDARRYDGAARLIKGFDRRSPGHADVPAVYLLGARLLIEHRRDEAQARRVLDALRRHYPATPAAGEAERLIELLDRLGAVA